MLKLEISLGNGDDRPTESQIATAFSEIHKFISKVIGGVMAAGDGAAADSRVGSAMNAAILLQQSADLFRGASPVQGAQLRGMPLPPGAQRQ
jgi:hypothetical protein